MDSLKIRLFFLIAFLSFHINALSTSQIVNDSINRYYGKAMSAHEKGDYKEMFVNLCIFIRNQTDTTSYRLKDAYYHLGHLYAHAHYVEQNVDSAVYCLKKASSYGSNKASRFLFNIYYYSNYNRVNKQEALKWLKMSASQGDIKSLYELGELYDFGKTVQLKDTSITTGYSEDGKIRYVRNAATQTKSTISIPGLVTNKRTAYEYYEKALDFNYQITNQKVGYYEVAVAYMDGTFFDKNYSKRLLGLDLLNLLNYSINNDERSIEITRTKKLVEYCEKKIPITTEEMIKMGLYDPKYDLDYLEPVN